MTLQKWIRYATVSKLKLERSDLRLHVFDSLPRLPVRAFKGPLRLNRLLDMSCRSLACLPELISALVMIVCFRFVYGYGVLVLLTSRIYLQTVYLLVQHGLGRLCLLLLLFDPGACDLFRLSGP